MAGQACLLGRTRRFVDMAQSELSLTPEGHAGISRYHTGGRALQQAGAELALEPADLLAQRRCHHAEIGRRPAHAAEFNRTDEIAELSEFHGL